VVWTLRALVVALIALLFGGCLGRTVLEEEPSPAAGRGSISEVSSSGSGSGGRPGSGGTRATVGGAGGGTGGDHPTAGTGGAAGRGSELDGGGRGGAQDAGTAPGGAPAGGKAPVNDPDEASDAGHGGEGPNDGGVGPTAEELDLELRARWNAVADARPPSPYSFHWQKDLFPHPTFQMGTPEGYHEFAFVLLGFLEAGDNFDFLLENALVRARLLYISPGSGFLLLDETFFDLTRDFSTMAFGDIPADVQSRLAAFAKRMESAE
jgi:hypothetical protein